MKRRDFLTSAAAGLAGGTVAAPAVAQAPGVRWRMATSWPKSLDTLYGSAAALCERVSQLTEGRFQIQPFAGGEIVGPIQVFDATANGTVECSHTLSTYFIGKNPVYGFDGGLPFGLNTRQQQAWMHNGGGLDLMREVFRKSDIVPVPVGNVGVQMGGWFRREINGVDDLKGLKFRVGGFGGLVMQKLGVVPQQIAAGDIYPALERGIIDAAEWVGPYDDEKLGFVRVAPVLLHARLVGGQRPDHLLRQRQGLGRLAARVPGGLRDGGERAECPHDGEVRRRQPAGVEASRRRRRAAPHLPAPRARSLLQGHAGHLRRDRLQERGFQAHLPVLAGFRR